MSNEYVVTGAIYLWWNLKRELTKQCAGQIFRWRPKLPSDCKRSSEFKGFSPAHVLFPQCGLN